MKNGYGNLFYDAILLGTILKHRATGGELEKNREVNLIGKIKSDRDMHKDDIISFTYNEIDRVYQLAIGYHDEWNSLFRFIRNTNLLNTKENKLKILAKLYNLSKKVGYNNLNLMLSSFSVYCDFINNEYDEEKLKSNIFSYSLPETVLKLLCGLTPNEVYRLFPIEKEYDGYKYETKDYYSCMEEARKIGLDKEMDSQDASNYIMDCNTHSFIFDTGVGMMMLASDYNKWDMQDIMDMLTSFKNERNLHIVKY